MCRAVLRSIVLMGVCLSSVCVAQVPPSNRDFEEKPWEEAAFELPSFPESKDLIPFAVGSRSDTQFAIDGKTISIGSDTVIHFALVIVSSSGARNISYEGMRCETAERRVYAFGRSDGTWSKARSDQWIRVRGDVNNPYVELYINYFCAKAEQTVATPELARRMLLKGGARSGMR